jgi:aryl-alcohol dehydrogenase-like predicted oxidoreductase
LKTKVNLTTLDKNAMRYRLLGRSGLRVSQLALGTMTFGDRDDASWGASFDISKRIFDRYLELGGNFVDTANLYTRGQSEEILGELIRGKREQIVLATKYTFNSTTSDPNAGGNHRKNLVQSLDASLKRLESDYIDLYWVHAWDGTTPVEELMRALDDQVRAGKILYVGISDTPAWVISQANTIARMRGWTPFIATQIEYSLSERTVERDLLPMARSFEMGVTAWSPLGGGVLTGKYHQIGSSASTGTRRGSFVSSRMNDATELIVSTVRDIAQARNVTPAQVAIAWVISRGKDVFPILGAKSLEQFEDNLGALNLTFTPDELRRLGEASAIKLGFPHEMLAHIRSTRSGMPSIFGVETERMELREHAAL